MAKKTIETKKTVVFIVEGSSDKKALEKIFQRIYKHKNIVFKFMGGDITSDEGLNRQNVCDAIYEKINRHMEDKKLKKSDIWKIVHIFDMDGAYIPDSAVEKSESEEFVYSVSKIFCKGIDRVLDRNKRKREMMDYLLSLDVIKGIPYVGYFMSSNLDHALYDEQNLDEGLKGAYADAFYTEFKGKEWLFIDFLREEVANGVPDDFPASWRYIKEGMHSLERHTNLHIYFKENPYKL